MPRAELPDLSIRVNGSELPAAGAGRPAFGDGPGGPAGTQHVHPGTAQLGRCPGWQVSWSDSSLFAIGNEVEIWLGYVGDLHKVMLAEITSLEPVFTADQPPPLTVRGYDHRHRLARGRKTRTFAKMKDSAIASQIAREAGLRAQVQRHEGDAGLRHPEQPVGLGVPAAIGRGCSATRSTSGTRSCTSGGRSPRPSPPTSCHSARTSPSSARA